jgi:ABC-2 type transport system permease protein
MIFLCGLFFPVERLPVWLQPLSHILPLTYGADVLHGAIRRAGRMSLALDFSVLAAFCVVLFVASLRNIRRRWVF